MSDISHNFAAGPSERMQEEIPAAFSWSEDEGEKPAAIELRAVVPAPAPLDFAEFEKESTNHRVLILKGGAVIAVTTLVSIGGALFIHSLFAGVFVLGMLFGKSPLVRTPGEGSGGDAPSEGGSGFMVLESPTPVASASSGLLKSATALLESPTPAALAPQLRPLQSEAIALAPPADVVPLPVVVALNSQMPEDFGSVRVAPPARPTASPVVADSVVVAPPGTSVASSSTQSPTPVSAASVRTGTAAGRGAGVGDDEYGDEPVFSLFKGEGSGQGTGKGRGSGIDRGLSGAYSKAQLLSPLNFRVPYQYRLKPPTKDILLNVTVLANGQPGEVSVLQSCGIPELDAAFKDYVAANIKFRPAFERGKAVSSVEQIGQMFGSE